MFIFLLKLGFLGSFLSNNLKTNQLEVNTDSQTSRAIARLKEPRDLFALPKDRDHECAQQTARWPTECQVHTTIQCNIYLINFIVYLTLVLIFVYIIALIVCQRI